MKVLRREPGQDFSLLCRTWLAVQIPYGGWFPLALAAGFFFLACLWFWGMTMLLNYLNSMACQQAVSPDQSLTGTDECGDSIVLQPSGDACIQLKTCHVCMATLTIFHYVPEYVCLFVCLSDCLQPYDLLV